MYIDKYNVEVVGQKYNQKKEKYDNNLVKLTLNSTEGMHIPMLEELMEANDGCDLELNIKIKQHQYED